MIKTILVVLCICLLFGSFVYAQTEGRTAEEARALINNKDMARGLVHRVVALIELSGCDQAFTACNDARRPIVWENLYIFVIDMNGKVLAHGASAGMIGKNLLYRIDPYGRLIRDMIEKSKTDTEGWINYKPMGSNISDKSIYFRKIGDNLVCCEYCR